MEMGITYPHLSRLERAALIGGGKSTRTLHGRPIAWDGQSHLEIAWGLPGTSRHYVRVGGLGDKLPP